MFACKPEPCLRCHLSQVRMEAMNNQYPFIFGFKILSALLLQYIRKKNFMLTNLVITGNEDITVVLS